MHSSINVGARALSNRILAYFAHIVDCSLLFFSFVSPPPTHVFSAQRDLIAQDVISGRVAVAVPGRRPDCCVAA